MSLVTPLSNSFSKNFKLEKEIKADRTPISKGEEANDQKLTKVVFPSKFEAQSDIFYRIPNNKDVGLHYANTLPLCLRLQPLSKPFSCGSNEPNINQVKKAVQEQNFTKGNVSLSNLNLQSLSQKSELERNFSIRSQFQSGKQEANGGFQPPPKTSKFVSFNNIVTDNRVEGFKTDYIERNLSGDQKLHNYIDSKFSSSAKKQEFMSWLKQARSFTGPTTNTKTVREDNSDKNNYKQIISQNSSERTISNTPASKTENFSSEGLVKANPLLNDLNIESKKITRFEINQGINQNDFSEIISRYSENSGNANCEQKSTLNKIKPNDSYCINNYVKYKTPVSPSFDSGEKESSPNKENVNNSTIEFIGQHVASTTPKTQSDFKSKKPERRSHTDGILNKLNSKKESDEQGIQNVCGKSFEKITEPQTTGVINGGLNIAKSDVNHNWSNKDQTLNSSFESEYKFVDRAENEANDNESEAIGLPKEKVDYKIMEFHRKDNICNVDKNDYQESLDKKELVRDLAPAYETLKRFSQLNRRVSDIIEINKEKEPPNIEEIFNSSDFKKDNQLCYKNFLKDKNFQNIDIGMMGESLTVAPSESLISIRENRINVLRNYLISNQIRELYDWINVNPENLSKKNDQDSTRFSDKVIGQDKIIDENSIIYISRNTLFQISSNEFSPILDSNQQFYKIHSRLVNQVVESVKEKDIFNQIILKNGKSLSEVDLYLEKRRLQNAIRCFLEYSREHLSANSLREIFNHLTLDDSDNKTLKLNHFRDQVKKLEIWPTELSASEDTEIVLALALISTSFSSSKSITFKSKDQIALDFDMFSRAMHVIPYNVPDYAICYKLINNDSVSTSIESSAGETFYCQVALHICEIMGVCSEITKYYKNYTYQTSAVLWDKNIRWESFMKVLDFNNSQIIELPFWFKMQDIFSSNLISVEEIQVVLKEIYSIETIKLAIEFIIGISTHSFRQQNWLEIKSCSSNQTPAWAEWVCLEQFDNEYSIRMSEPFMGNSVCQNIPYKNLLISTLYSTKTKQAIDQLMVKIHSSYIGPKPFNIFQFIVCCKIFVKIFSQSMQFKELRDKLLNSKRVD